MSQNAVPWIAVLALEDGQAIAYCAMQMDGPSAEVEREEHPELLPALPVTFTPFTLLDWMERDGFMQLWLHPSWSAAAGLHDINMCRAWVNLATIGAQSGQSAQGAPWRIMDRSLREPRWIRAYHDGQWGGREIAIVQLESRAPWREAPDGPALLAAVLRYNTLIGKQPYAWSPARTGIQLIRTLHTGPHATQLLVCEEQPEISWQSNLEGVFQWTRAPGSEELLSARYVQVYDKNAQFLSACSSLPLGVGNPRHYSDRTPLVNGDLFKKPGLWRLEIGHSAYTDRPDPFRPSVDAAADPRPDLWVSTPTLRLAFELGWSTAFVQEAYVWPQDHQVLNPWYKVVRDARLALLAAPSDDPASRIALAAIKSTYTHTIGTLALDRAYGREPSDLIRPDWRHQIMGQARANLYRNVAHFADDGRAPLAVMQDQVWLLSPYADPRTAAPTSMRLGPDLGSFKPKACAPVALVRDELDAMRVRDPRERLAAFFALDSAMDRLNP